MRISELDVLEALRRICSIVIRTTGFFVVVWACLLFSFLIPEAVTDYTYPDNPIESDYPAPVLFNVLIFVISYVFCLLVVICWDLVRKVRKK